MAGTSEYYFNNLLNADQHDTFDDCTPLDSPYSLNIEPEAVEMIIEFCYSGNIELTDDNVESILAGAKELQIESLISLCGVVLEGMLNINNCIRFLEIADKHEFDGLKKNALAMILDVLPQINELPEFFGMDGVQIVWLLEMLANNHDDMFAELLESVQQVENSFAALKLDGNSKSVFRAAVSQWIFGISVVHLISLNEFKSILLFTCSVYCWIFDA